MTTNFNQYRRGKHETFKQLVINIKENDYENQNRILCVLDEEPEYLDVILSDAKAALSVALIMNAPFPEAETIIATKASCACDYAYKVLKAPFPLGESAIMRDGLHAGFYARKVLHKVWPDAEPAIKTHKKAWALYVQEFPFGFSMWDQIKAKAWFL